MLVLLQIVTGCCSTNRFLLISCQVREGRYLTNEQPYLEAIIAAIFSSCAGSMGPEGAGGKFRTRAGSLVSRTNSSNPAGEYTIR